MIADDLIDRAGAGDLDALAELDRRGLSPAPNEDAPAFAERLRGLNANYQSMEGELAKGGTYTVEGVTVRRDARIPEEVFSAAGEVTEALYGFRCDWVPGFFLDPRFSGLFGGCAFYFYPDFFALFIIRHSFQNKERWLWYRRDELLAHELCHIARIGLESHAYEEYFAYQTAATAFRRVVGGIFRSQTDVFLFLGATLLEFCTQLSRAFFAVPLWVPAVGWAALVGVVAFLLLRLLAMIRTHHRAHANLAAAYGNAGTARHVLFHCTDAEIGDLARGADAALLRQWSAENLRWKIILHRFPLP